MVLILLCVKVLICAVKRQARYTVKDVFGIKDFHTCIIIQFSKGRVGADHLLNGKVGAVVQAAF